MPDLEHNTVVHSVSGEAALRLVAEVEEWRIEQEVGSDSMVMSVITSGGVTQSLRISRMDAQDMGEVLRRKTGPGALDRAAPGLHRV
ncbi:MAG: hypothetical protein P4L96_23620 [Rhodoferax sp.]|nr:hypothetical protein [Rhodoferax sp.]